MIGRKKSLAIIGGGRWSRVLMQYLLEQTENTEIIWVTSHSKQQNAEWLKQKNTDRVFLHDSKTFNWDQPLSAVIIATSASDHDVAIQKALQYELPVLCEKPLTFSYEKAKAYQIEARHKYLPLGIHYEYLFAEYLLKFSAQLVSEVIRHVEVHWSDPDNEVRGNEIKRADFSTPVTQDCYGHCWSLLKAIGLPVVQELIDLKLNRDNSIEITNKHQGFQSNFFISRRGKIRQRSISINNGKYKIDFSIEPAMKQKPVALAIASFLQVSKNSTLTKEWPLSIDHCIDTVRLAEEASKLLSVRQKILLTEKNLDKVDLDNLLLDMYLPLQNPKLRLQTESDFLSATEAAENFFRVKT